jgi:uncharacterized membrane protein
MVFEDFMLLAVHAFEIVGVLVLVLGSVAALVIAARGSRRGAPVFDSIRRNLGRAILLGLEILIVADIVQTITVDPTPASALTLGIIVLVRTFLSFSLEIELEGVVPWRRAAVKAPADEGVGEI